jgi:hypothetical protein
MDPDAKQAKLAKDQKDSDQFFTITTPPADLTQFGKGMY